MLSRRNALLAPLALAGLPARAQAYPSRQMTWVVGFPPGGSADLIARRMAERLSQEARQPVVVLNRPGAGGTLALEYVASAAPDGHTIVGAGAVSCAAESLYKNPRARLFRDVRMVAIMGATSNVMVVPKASPAATLTQFIAHAKANPGKLTYASTGNGTTPHLCAELFKNATGIELVHVPYKGSGQALTDLISQRVDVMFDNVATAMPYVNGGELRAFAVTASRPNPIAPGVPTLKELGIDLQADSWTGVSVHAKTPPETLR